MKKTFTAVQTVRLNTLQLVQLAHAEATRLQRNQNALADAFVCTGIPRQFGIRKEDLPARPKPRIRIVSPTEVTLEIPL